MANMIAQYSRDKREGKPLPDRDPNEHYATPYDAASIMSEILYRYWCSTRTDERTVMKLLDIGADEGVWGEAFFDVVEDLAMRREAVKARLFNLGGIEHRITSQYHLSEEDTQYDDWVVADATDLSLHPHGYKIAFGNPPFLKDGRLMTSWLAQLINHYEVVAFLLRTDFLGGERHYQQLFAGKKLAVMAQSIYRISFVGKGSQQTREFAFYIWDQAHKSAPMLSWFDHKKQVIDPTFLEEYRAK